jgi:hypothetical protein
MAPPAGSTKKLGQRPAEPTPVEVEVAPVVVQAPAYQPLFPPPPPRHPVVLWWPGPDGAARRQVLWTGAASGVGAAVLLPLDRPGIGWVLTALVAVGALFTTTRWYSHAGAAWGALGLALLTTGALYDSSWSFTLATVAAGAVGSLAVAGGRSPRGVLFGAVALPLAAARSLPWVARGLRGVRSTGSNLRLGRSVLVSAGLLVVFVPLLAGADAAFSSLLSNLVPDVDGGSVFRWIFLFLLVGFGTVGACYLLAAPTTVDDIPSGTRRTVGRREWVLPVGLLVALFALFVGVQLAVLFGGSDYVLRTADLTYAEYARGGFWQLLAVTLLALVVIAVTASLAPKTTAVDRRWLRGLLGALAGLTLVIVASALSRMWSYQEAYGFTELRLVVEACELWLGVVYLLVIASVVRLRVTWLPRAVVGTGVATLLVLAALNPDRLIAEQNVSRWEATGKIDTAYLSGLSADAVPVLAGLPGELRQCALGPIARQLTADGADEWREWNLSRSRARDVLTSIPALPARGCALEGSR